MEQTQTVPIDSYDGLRRLKYTLIGELKKVPSITEIQDEFVPDDNIHYDSGEFIKVSLESGMTVVIEMEYKSLAVPSQLIKRAEDFVVHKATKFNQLPDNICRVIAVPVLSEKVRGILEDRGFGYVDLAGNMLIKTNGLYIRVEGKTVNLKRTESRSDVFKRSSVKSRYILRLLLEAPGKQWYLKDLAKEAGVSTGQTSKVLQQLVEREIAIHSPEGYCLRDPITLIREWAEEYHLKPALKAEYYSMDSIPDIEDTIRRFADERGILYGMTGFSGASRISPVVRYNRVHFYFDGHLEELAEYAGWKTGASGSNISSFSIPDPQLLKLNHIVKEISIVPVSQLCLDLLGMPGRGAEAAEAVMMEVFRNHER